MKVLSSQRYILLHIISPVILGVIVYIFWRGISSIDPLMKVFPLFSSKNLPAWLQYSLPDGLWLYALLSSLLFIWKDNDGSQPAIIWIVLAITLSFSMEILQAFHWMPGTFDWKDLLSYSVATFMCLSYNLTKIKH